MLACSCRCLVNAVPSKASFFEWKYSHWSFDIGHSFSSSKDDRYGLRAMLATSTTTVRLRQVAVQELHRRLYRRSHFEFCGATTTRLQGDRRRDYCVKRVRYLVVVVLPK
jgi:hypothetical protein